MICFIAPVNATVIARETKDMQGDKGQGCCDERQKGVINHETVFLSHLEDDDSARNIEHISRINC